MYCIKCGKQIDDDSLFCSFCGNKVETELESDSAVNQNQQEEKNILTLAKKSIEEQTSKTKEFVENKKEVLKETISNKTEQIKKATSIVEVAQPKEKEKKKLSGALIAVIIVIGVLIVAAAVIFFVPKLGIRCAIFGHKSSGEYTIEKEPTCTEDGIKRDLCAICDFEFGKEIVIEKSEHNKKYRIEKEATCTEDGIKRYYCNTCGCDLGEEVIEKLGHDYIDGYCVRCHEKDPKQKYLIPNLPVMQVNTIYGLNLRERPSTKSKIIAFMEYETLISVQGTYGEWVKTTINGTTGWCSSEYLDPVMILKTNRIN